MTKQNITYFFTLNSLIILFSIGFSLSLWSQSHGIIVDHENEPIEGVEVSSPSGDFTFSNFLGQFKIYASAGDTLTIHHISYISKQIVASQGPIHIRMKLSGHVLDQIEINSNWVFDNQAVTKSTVTKEELESRGLGQDVPYLLRWTPSAVVTSDGGTGIGYTYLRIRGSDQERINFTINGVPLNDAESQQVFWVDLPDFASSTDQVQIQRGLGLSTNGAGAFGASVNFSTHTFSSKPKVSISSGFGSYGTYRINTQFESGQLSDHFYLKGRLSKVHSNGYIDRAKVDLHSLFLGVGADFGEHSIQTNIFSGSEVTYQAWNGVPINFVEDDVLRRFNSAGMGRADMPHPNEVDDYDQTHFQLIHQWTINKNLISKLTAHYTQGAGFFELYQGNENLQDYKIGPVVIGNTTVTTSDLIERRWLDNDFYGLIGNFQYLDTPGNMRFKWGGAWSEYRGDHFGEVIWAQVSSSLGPNSRYYDNEATKSDWNIYTQVFKDISPAVNVFVDLQYRRVSHNFLGLDESANDFRDDYTHGFFNPKAGVNYSPDSRSKVYIYGGYGHKEPNRNDFVSSSPSSRPRAEKLLNIEGGYSRHLGKFEFNANVYWMQYKDQLVPTGELNDVGAANRINVDNSYRLGLEWGSQVDIFSKLNVAIGGAFSINKIRELEFFRDGYGPSFEYLGQTSEILQDVNLPLSPSVLLQGQVSWSPPIKRLKMIGETKYIGRQYLDNSQSVVASLNPYTFTNLTMDYHFGNKVEKGLTLRVLVQNIFDVQYESFGWTYPYIFPGETSGDYTVRESPGRYRDIGLYPQGRRNFIMSGTFSF